MRLLITVTTLSLFGCSSVTDFDRFHGGGPSDAGMDAIAFDGGRDAGRDAGVDASVDAGDVDAGPGDAGCGDTLIDPLNCGMCGHECESTPQASPTCEGGACVNVCETGYEDCNGIYDDGCETDLGTLTDCGDCDVACDPSELCSMGAGCVSSCVAPEEMCGTACVDTTMSPMHCGGCGMPCPSYTRATAACSASVCEWTCEPGYEDCDGDLAANGCETRLMPWYADADGDGFGAVGSTGMMLCDDDAMMMGLSTNAMDCDDTNDTVAPGRPESCNNVDDDCDGAVDDGNPGGGSSCGMDTGECMSGTNNCRSGSIACEGAVGPATETCNGLDDDCNGAIDQTFACARGATRTCVMSCTSPGGIVTTSTGTETCSDTCAWGPCVIPETCDRIDNDCNGFVDEGLLVAGPTITVGPGTFGVRVAWSGSLGRLGVVWRAGAIGSAAWYFGEVDATGTVLGTLRLDTAYSDYTGDVAFNGNNWVTVLAGETVGAAATGLLYWIRPATTTGAPTLAGNGAFPAAQSGTFGPNEPRVVRRTDGSNDVGVVWIENTMTTGGRDYVRAAIYRDLAAAHTSVHELVDSANEDYRHVAVAPIGGAELAATAAYVNRSTGMGAIGWGRFGSGTPTLANLFADAAIEVGQEMTFIPGDDVVLVTWGEQPGTPSAASYWSLVTPTATPTATPKTPVGMASGARVVSGWADDAAFGLAFDPTSAGTTVRRYQLGGSMTVPSDVVVAENEVSDMTGMPAGPHRYALGFVRAGQAMIRYVSCPP